MSNRLIQCARCGKRHPRNQMTLTKGNKNICDTCAKELDMDTRKPPKQSTFDTQFKL